MGSIPIDLSLHEDAMMMKVMSSISSSDTQWYDTWYYGYDEYYQESVMWSILIGSKTITGKVACRNNVALRLSTRVVVAMRIHFGFWNGDRVVVSGTTVVINVGRDLLECFVYIYMYAYICVPYGAK